MALYPPANFPNPDNSNKPSADEALGQIFTDVTFTCRGFDSNRLLAKFVPVHAYEFADPNAPDLFQPLIGFSYGASHASELQYLFDAKTLQGPADAAANAASPAPGAAVQPPPLTAGGTQLAAEMKGYWANFVRFHDPTAELKVMREMSPTRTTISRSGLPSAKRELCRSWCRGRRGPSRLRPSRPSTIATRSRSSG